MNLVAKEFVAAQPAGDPGVLVLSRFAGAAQDMDGALIVNPYDVEGVAERLHEELTMPLNARQERWRAMYKAIAANEVTAGREAFMQALQSTCSGRSWTCASGATCLPTFAGPTNALRAGAEAPPAQT